MNIVRWEAVSADSVEFTVDYGGKRARIKLEELGIAGEPKEDGIPWKLFYLGRLKELFAAIQASDTHWADRGSE